MPGVRPAQAILNEIRNGELMQDLAQELHEATMAAQALAKKATVTVTIDIAPQTKNMVEPIFTITGSVSSKLPKPDVPNTIFGLDDDGNLTRNLVRSQKDLGFSIASKNGTDNGDND